MNASDFETRFKAAMLETEEILRANPGRTYADPTLPIYRVDAEHRLDEEQERFEKGDKMALLGAIRLCANHDLPLPHWAAMAFIRAYDKVLRLRTGSWDAAFGRPYPKGSQLAAMKKRQLHRLPVCMAVKQAKDAGIPIDVGLFGEIGKRFGIGATLVAELYYGKRPKKTAPARLSGKSKKSRNYSAK